MPFEAAARKLFARSLNREFAGSFHRPMEIYLPIAQMSVHWIVILGMGLAVGFLSGMFGIGGGFLLTPLLIFYGIPPGVAVATTASQVTASTFSGMISHWRQKTVDLKMGGVMLAGGLAGTAFGVYLFGILRRVGQAELTVSASYVILLGAVGGLMLNESVRTLRAVRAGQPAGGRKPGQHNWVHGLPFKMRFRRSRLYISVIPPALLGFTVGILSAIMGVGGGFIMVPVMIYVLRVPTNVTVGTSLFQVLFVTAASTVLHAVDNYTVDIMLALLLILGGVVGVQFGVRMAARLRGEQLRMLLALLALAMALRLLYDLVATPPDLYSLAVSAT
ncbi:MAG TPA: sulfite exporter TauE/SafE family protein [Rhizomicrobium sp.]|nr:sulfite exporter TauE/SafE family protein [Rhizomicrobium sp.]